VNSISASTRRFQSYLAAAGLYRGFTPEFTTGVRVTLLVGVLLLAYLFLWRPLRRLAKDKGASLVEKADAAFDGRVQTYLDTQAKSPEHSFLPLLARDSLAIAKRVPLSRVVPTASLLIPLFLIALLLAGGVAFHRFAPPQWQNAALHLFWGWQKPGLVEPRRIAVLPGDTEMLAGENLDVEIELGGFSRDVVTLYARSGAEPWQTTEIAKSVDGQFRFTVFQVREALEYYVEASHVRSESFDVSVVVPPRLEALQAKS